MTLSDAGIELCKVFCLGCFHGIVTGTGIWLFGYFCGWAWKALEQLAPGEPG